MKAQNIFNVAAAALSLSALALPTTFAVAAGSGDLIVADTQEVFVPAGFDDNDEVVAVLDGYLPDSCHKLDAATSILDPKTGKITVTQMARRWPGPCRFKLIPFTSTVALGIVAKGKYQIEANNGRLNETLDVAEAHTSGPDDFLYAPVDSISILPTASKSHKDAVIEGRFTNSCMTFDEVRVINSGKTIEVLPIIKLEERPNCEVAESPFRKVVTLPEGLSVGRHLLHVRSLNGRSLNFVFSVSDENL